MSFLNVLGVVFKPVADYFNNRQVLKAQAAENELNLLKAQGERQAQLARDGLAADAAWEMEFAKQAAASWKDEFELIIISMPLVMCFVPGWDQYVLAGFEALSECPQWFTWLVLTIYLANYGIRFWRKTQSDT